MVEKFLKAKHWQLFLLTIGIPMVLQFILIGGLISEISKGTEGDPEMVFNYFKIFPFIMVLFTGILFGWFWSIGVGLDRIIPEELKLNVGWFKILLLIPIIYILCVSIFIGTMFNGFISPESTPNLGIFGLIIPLHLFSMFCIFYCMYFVAKTIKTAELQKEVEFGDFIGEFFMIWFFPIGIWFLQPRINKMIRSMDRQS